MWQIAKVLLNPITSLVSWGVGEVSDHYRHKRRMKELEREAETKAAENLANADEFTLREKKNWIFGYAVMITTLPIVGSFFESTAPFVKRGFELLNSSVPEWYVALYVVVIVSIMSARSLSKYVFSKLGKKK